MIHYISVNGLHLHANEDQDLLLLLMSCKLFFSKLFLGIVFTIEVINSGDLICKFCGVSQEFV